MTVRAYRETLSSGKPRVTLEVEVEDQGPGIEDLSKAVLDAYSRGRFPAPDDFDHRPQSLGAGLGAVRRLMDSVEFRNKEEGGLVVRAHKYLP